MRKLLVLLVLAFGCSHVPPMGDPTVDCAKGVSPDVIPAVENALISGDYTANLVPLVAKFGLCVIQKAVAAVVASSKLDAAAASDDRLAVLKVQHGEAWLRANP